MDLQLYNSLLSYSYYERPTRKPLHNEIHNHKVKNCKIESDFEKIKQ